MSCSKLIRHFQGPIQAITKKGCVIVPAARNRRRPVPADPDQTTTTGRIPERPYTP